MSQMKNIYSEIMEYRENELTQNPESWINDIFDYLMETDFYMVPLSEVPITEKYVNDHIVEVIQMLYEQYDDIGYSYALSQTEHFKKAYLVRQMIRKSSNSDLSPCYAELDSYIKTHLKELETCDFLLRQYKIYLK